MKQKNNNKTKNNPRELYEILNGNKSNNEKNIKDNDSSSFKRPLPMKKILKKNLKKQKKK